MKTEEIKKEMADSEKQAWAQLSSICEMVAKLTREGAAKVYADAMTEEECQKFYEANGIREGHTLEEMRENIAELIATDEALEPDDFEWDEDDARQTIQDDALSVEVRSGWYQPGQSGQPEEFKILLCTGGPAVQIRGELDEHNEPHRAWIEHQDWGTPWQQIFGLDKWQQEALMGYCQQFLFES